MGTEMSEYEFLVPEMGWSLQGHQRQQEQVGAVVQEERTRNLNLEENQQKDHTNNNIMSAHSHMQQDSFNQNNLLHSSASIPISMKNIHRIEELTWENGQLAMHGHGGSFLPSSSSPKAKPAAWGMTGDTLESIVCQASTSSIQHNQYHVSNVVTSNTMTDQINMNNGSSLVDQKPDKMVRKNPGRTVSENRTVPVMKKRMRSGSDMSGRFGGTISSNLFMTSSSNSGYRNYDEKEEGKINIIEPSMRASVGVPVSREDRDTTMMTWPSFDSSQSFKTNMTMDDDSVASPGGSENQDDDHDTKTETDRSLSSRQTRAAAIHNQSERRRRDRINQKMKTLQRLLPNSRKTDKASMLDEVIEYLKQLQAEVHMMSSMRNMSSMPHMMMMPIGMSPQQQLQMALLSRMSAGGVGIGLGMGSPGIGAGMGMLDMSAMARSPAHQLPPGLSPFLNHPTHHQALQFNHPRPISTQPGPANAGNGGGTIHHLPDPYCMALMAQKMNDIEIYNKMAALYSQPAASNPSTTANEAKRE